jgi:hypothetical protein
MSAQLMLCPGTGGRPGNLRIYAINDLGWPVSLLDLAVGTLLQSVSASPSYFIGHDAGSQSIACPAALRPADRGRLSRCGHRARSDDRPPTRGRFGGLSPADRTAQTVSNWKADPATLRTRLRGPAYLCQKLLVTPVNLRIWLCVFSCVRPVRGYGTACSTSAAGSGWGDTGRARARRGAVVWHMTRLSPSGWRQGQYLHA